jgi:glycosyltransferase involved in cell wall biosynthesis
LAEQPVSQDGAPLGVPAAPRLSASFPPIEIIVPVHNEAATIRSTLQEFHRVAVAAGLDVRFQVSEDGSADGTAEVVAELAHELPITLASTSARKGYTRAVLDGLRATTRPVVGYIDGDGQCDPASLCRLVEALEGADLAIGHRSPRVDTAYRRLMSGAFGLAYRALCHVELKDPSYAYGLIRRPALDRVLAGRVGVLPQGFWWEFNARAIRAGIVIRQVPMSHRPRPAGSTQIYTLRQIPRVAFEHIVGLWRLRQDLA